MMIEAGPGDGEKTLRRLPRLRDSDFSVVQGFQVVGADLPAAEQNAEPATTAGATLCG